MADQVQPKAAAPAQTAPAANTTTAPKKSNTCMIVVIILLVLLVLGGVGGYLAYRYVKGKVKSVVDNAGNTSSSYSSTTTTTTTTSSSSDQEVKNNFNNTNPVTATSTQGKTYSTEVSGILTPIFGGAKLSEWMDLNGGDSMTFLVPRKVTAADFTAIENGFIAKGYSKTSNYTTSTDMSVYFDNSTVEILVGTTVGEATVRTTVAPKS